MQNSIPARATIRLSSFTYLNAAQFLGAFNDNFYRGLTVYLLLDLSPPDAKGRILSLAGALFLFPFLIFSSSAGRLADRFSKSRIIVAAKIAEIVVMSLGLVAFQWQSFAGSLAVLSAMAAQSAFFGPSKYGIIPEIVPRETIARANGWLAMYSHVAIVLGTGLSGLFCDLAGRNFIFGGYFCVAIAIVGTLFSFGIQQTRGQNAAKELHWRFWRDILANWRRAAKVPKLQAILLAYFAGYHLAGYIHVSIIPYAIDALGRTDTSGNYLFSYTSIGIGIGSMIAGQVNRHSLKLHHVPRAFFFAGLGLAGLALFSKNIYFVLLSLQVTGICMGFFIVPSETYLQTATPAQDRGEMLSTSNFLSFSGALAATGTLYVIGDLFNASPAWGFGVYAVFAALVGLALRPKLANSPLR